MAYRTAIPVLLVAFVLAGCTTQPGSSSPAPTLAGTSWTLVEIEGAPLARDAALEPISIAFDADGSRVSGYGGCNRFSGGYVVTDARLRFEPLAMTKMACLKGGDHETAFHQALASVTQWRIAGDTMEMRDGRGAVVLGWKAAGAQTGAVQGP